MRCRQNWSLQCEQALNAQINREYCASLSYHMLSTYFDRDDVGLNNLRDYFAKASLEEREHADKLMSYQNMRGGVVCLDVVAAKPFQVSAEERNTDIHSAFVFALDLEKTINEYLLELHKVADENNDAQFADYLEGEFLKEQVTAISELSKIISVLNRFNGDQHAIWNYVQTL